MRTKRLSFVAGWAAVALLAAVGFAAFGTPDATHEELMAEAAAASIGHTAGAYAGLGFALVGNDGEPAVIRATVVESDSSDPSEASAGTVAESSSGITTTIPTSGWLSEVEVRALVTQYFEPTDVNKAVRIAWCESRFDPNAKNLRTGGVGLFSHLPQYWEDRAGFEDADPTDPEASTAAAAWEVYSGAGWGVFSCG
jgi:hypothetical protein